jgi:hypothetical protein
LTRDFAATGGLTTSGVAASLCALAATDAGFSDIAFIVIPLN